MDAPVYKKLTDIENQRENPYQTSYGHDVISIQESFEARLFREGRPANTFTQGTTANASVLTSAASLKPSPGCVLVPMSILISCDVDAVVQIAYNTAIAKVGVSSNGIVYETVFLKAGTPLTLSPKGIKIYETGSIQLGVIPSVSGKLYGSIYGVEVTDNHA